MRRWIPALVFLTGCYNLTGLGTNPAPQASILSHEDGDSEAAETQVTLRGVVSDENHRAEQLTVSWWQGEARICGPVAAEEEGRTSCYTDLFTYEPNLASNNLQREAVTNTGNLREVVFDPTDSDQAWVLSASAGSSVAPWNGSLLNGGGNYHSFSGWTVIDLAVDEAGVWRMFVGRNGQVWFTDGGWTSPPTNSYSNQQIPNFSSPPWNGGSNDYLTAAAFRPGTCEALVVGDATAGQGLVVQALLQ
jgi:hypothetical protein